jgi:hypothetical protein
LQQIFQSHHRHPGRSGSDRPLDVINEPAACKQEVPAQVALAAIEARPASAPRQCL